MPQNIQQQLSQVQSQIAEACLQAGRSRADIHLLAVSKTQPLEAIQQAIAAGQYDFGENYLQEALDKIQHLQRYNQRVHWHFIGPIQSNKTKPIAEYFSWVHSVDRFKIAEHLNKYRPQHLPPLNICLQVNIDQEPTKSGVLMAELLSLATAIQTLPRLRLRGLMAIPAPREGIMAQRQPFARLKQALNHLNQQGFALDTLSMGMSDDLTAAIWEGATWVRVGTAIFGTRL